MRGMDLPQASRQARPRWARLSGLARVVPLLLIALAVAVQIGVAIWSGDSLPSDHTVNAVLNVTCTAVVVTSAWRSHGQLRMRLSRSLNTAFLLHGCLCLVVLVTRLPFSRTSMLLTLGLSLAGGALIVFLRERTAGPRVGVILNGAKAPPLAGAEMIASPTQDLRRYNVILTPMNMPLSAEWSAALSRAMLSGTQLRHVAEYLEEARGQTSIKHFHIDHLSDQAGHYAWIKRVSDLAATLLLLPVTLPLMLITALLVLVMMGRPVLFVQERIGLGGRRFRMFKFRTMASSASGEARAAKAGDLRVTPLGHILRRYRLDELPQFLNIALGDMSLIGPRPEWTLLHDEYVRQEPAYVYRNLVRPGITGWAQIRSGYSSNIAEARIKLSFNLYYVKNISLALDLQIAVRTLWALVTGYGAR